MLSHVGNESYFSFLPSHFISMEHMLMLMFTYMQSFSKNEDGR